MTDFGKKVREWTESIERATKDVHISASEKVRDSIALGPESEAGKLTGAPGQPIDTGDLRGSYIEGLRFIEPLYARLSTNVEYARPIEDGIGPHGPMTLQSEVGGFHSVKLTVNGWQKIMDAAKREVLG